MVTHTTTTVLPISTIGLVTPPLRLFRLHHSLEVGTFGIDTAESNIALFQLRELLDLDQIVLPDSYDRDELF